MTVHFLVHEMHPTFTQLSRVDEGVDVLGYRVFPNHIRLRRDNGYRFRRRLRVLSRAYARGETDLGAIKTSVAAWLGHTRHAQSEALCRHVLAAVPFVRGAAQNESPSCDSRRRLEQQTGERPVSQPQQEQAR